MRGVNRKVVKKLKTGTQQLGGNKFKNTLD